MKTRFIIFFILIFSLQLYAQNRRVPINGKIKADSVSVRDVYIINKNSQKATISDENGEFQISVKESDTLFISSIQFESQHLLINQTHLNNFQLIIYLRPQINQLEEVVVQKPVNMAMALGLPNASKKPLTQIERKLNYYSKASLPLVILGTLIGQQGGIENIYYIVSGNRKKDRKLKQLIDADKRKELNSKTIKNIRLHFGDDFFIKTLQIPKKEIDLFIESCESKDIINLFNKGKTLEVTDILIKESKTYKK